MKKIITWILLAAMLLGMFAGCEKSEDPTQLSTVPVETTEAPVGENNAAEVTAYLQAIYKDSGAETAGNFERFGVVRIAGVPYEVVWTADVGEDLVKIIVNDDGTVTIDVNEKCSEDTTYVLTATVTDANGNTSTATWEYLLPGAASLEEMHAIIDQAYALEKGEAMAEEVVLSGIIKSIDTPWSEQYQNITVTIQVEGREDKPIMCYRLKGEGAKDLNPGDTITVQGLIKNYNGTIEFDAGCQLVTVEKTGTPIEIPTDPHEILNDVYALGDNESLPYGPVTLTGSICAIDEEYSEQYKNITVTILIDWYTIKCYRMSGEGVEDLEMNDIITVQGYIKKYNGTREFDKPTLLDVVKVGAYAQPKDPVEVVTAAYALDPGWTLPYSPVTLTGTITEVNSSWSAQYENITVTFVVDGAESMPIECYRMVSSGKATDEVIKTLGKGDRITVTGMLMKYQSTSTGKTKVEFNCPELLSVTKAEELIVNAAYALEVGESLDGTHSLRGKITKINTAYSAKYGNITVTIQVGDMADKPIMCYRMKGYGADSLAVGDEIIVTGTLTNYKGTIEFASGCTFIPVELPDDPVELVNIAYSLADGQSFAESCSLTGKITKINTAYSAKYGNITVTIQVDGAEDKPIMCYRMKGNGADALAVGDEITVTGILKNYKGTIEFDTGCTFVLVSKGEAEDGDDDSNDSAIPTITFDDTAKRTVGTTEQQVWVENGITVTNDKASSSSNVNTGYYNPVRFYKSSSVTIAYPGMTMIKVTCNNASYATALVNSISDATATADGAVVTIALGSAVDSFTIPALTAQVRVDSIAVYTEATQGGDNTGSDNEDAKVPETLAEQIAAAEKLDDNALLPYKSEITGVILNDGSFETKDYYGTTQYYFYVSDGTNTIKCYGLVPTGSFVPAVGDTVKINGYLTAYGGVAQFSYASDYTLELVKKGEDSGESDSGNSGTTTPEVAAATITFDDTAKRTVGTTEQQVWVENGITVTNDKASSTSNVNTKYYNPVRLYQGSSLKVEYTGMKKIVITCGDSTYASNLVNSISDTSVTVTVDGAVVTIELSTAVNSYTIEAMAKQVRVASIAVYTG